MKGERICRQNSIPKPLSPTPKLAGVIMYFPPGRALQINRPYKERDFPVVKKYPMLPARNVSYITFQSIDSMFTTLLFKYSTSRRFKMCRIRFAKWNTFIGLSISTESTVIRPYGKVLKIFLFILRRQKPSYSPT